MDSIFYSSKKSKTKRYFSITFLLYIFGRFRLVRFLYKNFNRIIKNFTNKSIESSNKNYLEYNTNYLTILNKLKKDGICEGFKLNSKILDELINLSNKSELISTSQKKFHNFQDVNNFNEGNNKPCCSLYLTSPDLNKLAEEISRDQILLNIVRNFRCC